VLFGNWRTGDSGVDTFVRHIEPLFRDGRVDGELVEIPYREVDCRATESLGPARPGEGPPLVSRDPAAWRLLIGYLRRVLHDLRALRPLRKKLRDRALLTNQFGCETLPLALRILSPRGTVTAICHTHPKKNTAGHDGVRRLVEKLAYRSANHVIYNSHSVREEWRKRLGLKNIKGSVIWYGIDPPDTSIPADYPPKPPGTVDFVCVSRFARWKGHRELIDAFAEALRRQEETGTDRTGAPPAIRLILVGDGPHFPEALKYARGLGLTPQPRAVRKNLPAPDRFPISFMQAKPNADRYFNAADVGVQLSTEPEAFGITLVEAMSRRKPVLASRIGGIREAVEDGQTGILVDPTDTSTVAKAILDLARDAGTRSKMGAAGHQRWRDHFTVERMQHDYAVFLSSVA